VSRARFGGRPALLLLILSLFLGGVSARAAEEAGLMELWKKHMAAPDDHEAVVKACHEFEAAHAGDPLLPVVRGVEIWHALRVGTKVEARQMLEADLIAPAGSVNDGARRLAQGWLTRLDREQVAAALQGYYRKEIAYPKSLEQLTQLKLTADGMPPLHDRFGQPWSYQLTGFGRLPGFTDQKYALRSVTLGETSDFKTAVRMPYAAHIQAVPVQVMSAGGGPEAVKFNLGAGGASVISLGQAAGDLHLAFVGARIVVVCDYSHWKILPRP